MDCERPSKEEIVKAIKTLKSEKAPESDNKPPETLKADPYTTAGMLYELFGKIWEVKEMPTEWNKSHRGISLLIVVGKILNRVMLLRLQRAVDTMLRDQQAGFRKDRSCTYQIAILRIIIEQSIEWITSVYVKFVDFEKAFNSLDRSALWSLMMH